VGERGERAAAAHAQSRRVGRSAAIAQQGYLAALQPVGEKDDDVIGYVFAINGKLNSAEIYPSNGLFRKMWAKLLNANATEAIGEKVDDAAPPPSIDSVTAFLAASERGERSEKELPNKVRLETRDSEGALYLKTSRRDGGWVHRSYLAK
jgi:ARG and Rhodanese-Phosphatase-superfamily-associated Protein domain